VDTAATTSVEHRSGRPIGLGGAALLGLLPVGLFVLDWLLFADPARGVDSMAPGYAMFGLAALYPGWIALMSRASGTPWLLWALAIVPALVLVPAFFDDTLTDRHGNALGFVDMFLLRGLPLVGIGIGTAFGARAARAMMGHGGWLRTAIAFGLGAIVWFVVVVLAAPMVI